MLLYVYGTLFVSLAAGYSVLDGDFIVLESNSEELSWPEKYTVKATKLTLTSNLVEDFTAWRTNSSSRIDYNKGAVKSIIYLGTNDTGEDVVFQYEIHPETIDGEEPELKCNSLGEHGLYELSTESILPSIDYEIYEAVGNETIREKETVKFESIDLSRLEDVRKTIWAVYEESDYGDSVWVPIRYEKKEFNHVLGSLTNHEIWDFYDFYVDFDDDVFDVDDYDCSTKSVTHSADSDKVVKELMFVNANNKKHVDHVFNKYITNFERKYASEIEHFTRRAIFKQNTRLVSAVNKMNLGYKLTINQFSDRTPKEMERSKGLKRRPEGKTGNVEFPYHENTIKHVSSKLPKEYDLRLHDLVSNVKNQGECGSCWTYGTTAAVEGALARVNGGRLLSLSNQALVDCVWESYGSSGCDGGSDTSAYDWMIDFGLPTEEEYGSYKNRDDFCRIANMTKTYPIRGYTDVTPVNNEATKVAVVKHGPLSVSVHVSDQFYQYSGGIFFDSNCDPNDLDHEVALVGYGERYGELFWILKNSWGVNWGIDGYMLIAAKDNTCGVTTEPTYVVL